MHTTYITLDSRNLYISGRIYELPTKKEIKIKNLCLERFY